MRSSNLRLQANCLYGFGKQIHRLTNNKMSHTFIPSKIMLEGLEHVEYKDIAISVQHGLISFKKNNKHGLFSFGLNTRGQLGLNRISSKWDYGYVKNIDNLNILQLACGREHSIIKVEKENDIFLLATGSSNYGQIAIGNNEIKSDDKQVPFTAQFKKIKDLKDIKSITCGLDHTAVLTNNNQVLTMGWNADGQLGLGLEPPQDKSVPTLLPYFIKYSHNLVKITSCHDCTFVLNDKGELFSWGNSEYGQGGQGRIIDRILEPTKVNFDEKIVDVVSGGSFTLFLTDNGKVFTVGFGVLGLGGSIIETVIPLEIPNLDNIQNIHASSGTACAINSMGQVFIWGMVTPTSFGNKDPDQHCFKPKLLDLPYDKLKVVKVALGTNYNLIIGKE